MSDVKLSMCVGMKVRLNGPIHWRDRIGTIRSREDEYSVYDWEIEVPGHGLVCVFENELEPLE